MPRRLHRLASPILLLALFATACAPRLPAEVQVVRPELPPSLTAPCEAPPMPDEAAGDGAFFGWVADVVEALQGCDARMTAIRAIATPPAP